MIEHVPTVLIIDDEESMRDSCGLILTKDSIKVEMAENGEVGLKKVQETKPDLVLIDLKMPGISGFEVLEKIKEIDRNIIPVVITGYATVESAVEAMKKGAYDFLPKPFTPAELRIIIKRGLGRRKLILETESLRREKRLMEENFITMVSHQLRSPISAIIQYFEVILGGMVGKVEPKQKEMLSKARDRLEGLLELINDWLDVAQMDEGSIVKNFKPLSLKKVLNDVVEFMQPSAQEECIRVELVPTTGSDRVQGDEDALVQVFTNLVTNAIKYNKPNGSVKVSLKEELNFVVVEVTDTGIGISKEHIPLLFDQFYRVARSEGKKKKGTGLGLTIAKKIIDAHRGKIEVTSEEGKGSTFSVFLHKTLILPDTETK
jgi:two-component system sensor histidine kinase/response regulator